MKIILTLICALAFVLAGRAVPADGAMERALADAVAAVDAAEAAALRAATTGAVQTVEEINAAALERVVRELELTSAQRKRFEPLYKAYRQALADAVVPAGEDAQDDQAQQLKRRLDNISAAAQVKREYVDRFAAVLTPEQIRRLYNAEGEIGSRIKRASAARTADVLTLKGAGRQVTQDYGPAGDYTAIEAANFFSVTVSPTARTIEVTADEQLIDYLEIDRSGGVLRFRFAARQIDYKKFSGSAGARIVVPASASLNRLKAASYGSIVCQAPLRAESMTVEIASYGRVEADIAARGRVTLSVSSYGKFSGAVECGEYDLKLSSYGSLKGDLVCAGRADASVGSYARLAGGLRSGSLALSVSSGGSVQGEIRVAQQADVDVASYAKYGGEIHAPQLRIDVASSGSVSGAFVGERVQASVGSYGKCTLKGAAKVCSAVVSVASGGSFSAQELQVADYVLTVANDSRADVWCSGTLKVDAARSARVSYDGPCRVENRPDNVRRRR